MSIETGGPAFPQGIDQGASEAGFPIVEITGGLTIRDYFAAKALQGLLGYPHTTTDVDDFAQTAYRHADAMIKERNNG
jgi:hypothetical protein